MNRKKVYILLILLIILVVTLAGFENIAAVNFSNDINDESELFRQKTGVECKVQLRRDMLGQSSDFPTPPTIDKLNGAEVQVAGEFITNSDEWIILSNDNQEIWIKKENILLIQFQQ